MLLTLIFSMDVRNMMPSTLLIIHSDNNSEEHTQYRQVSHLL